MIKKEFQKTCRSDSRNSLDSLHNEKSKSGEYRAENMDLAAGIAVFFLGLFAFVSGIYMMFFAVTGSKVWYYSPGFFPCFVGIVLMIASSLMSIKKVRSGASLKGVLSLFDIDKEKRKRIFLLLKALGLFAVYIFVLLGRIPFVLATFLYLSITMIVFRTENYPIWKLLLISAGTTGVVFLLFGVFASIPMP